MDAQYAARYFSVVFFRKVVVIQPEKNHLLSLREKDPPMGGSPRPLTGVVRDQRKGS